jgi:hypothetical protein
VSGTGGGITNTLTVSLTVATTTTPGFTIKASPDAVKIAQGASGAITIATTAAKGFDSAIALSASGQPSGATVSFSPASIPAPGSGSSTMSISVSPSLPAGTYIITVSGTGGGITNTASVFLTVTN